MELSDGELLRLRERQIKLDARVAQDEENLARKREMLQALEEALIVLPKTAQANNFNGKFSAYDVLRGQGWLAPKDGNPMSWNEFDKKSPEEIRGMLEGAIAHLKKVLGVYVVRESTHEQAEEVVQ